MSNFYRDLKAPVYDNKRPKAGGDPRDIGGIINFNIRGTKIQTSSFNDFIASNPTAKLSQIILSHNHVLNPEIYMDHNPLSFQAIVDYFKYGQMQKIYCPRNVSKDVLILQLQEFGIPYNSFHDITEDITATGLPPAYSTGDLGSALTAMQKRLALLFAKIKQIITVYANRGHRNVRIIITSHLVQLGNIAGEFDDVPVSSSSSIHYRAPIPNEIICLDETAGVLNFTDEKNEKMMLDFGMPDMSFLLQPECLDAVEEMCRSDIGCRASKIVSKEVMLRSENEFGLLESKSTPIVCLTLAIA